METKHCQLAPTLGDHVPCGGYLWRIVSTLEGRYTGTRTSEPDYVGRDGKVSVAVLKDEYSGELYCALGAL